MPDQAPQTLDQLIDTYKNDLATAKRLRDYGMEIETDGRLKLALTALIERVIGEKFTKHTQKGYEEFTHRRKRSDGLYEYASKDTAFIVNREIDEQRKRLGELL